MSSIKWNRDFLALTSTKDIAGQSTILTRDIPKMQKEMMMPMSIPQKYFFQEKTENFNILFGVKWYTG